MSDPWDEERRRPPPENDSEWPERDLWQSWDRPAEPEPEAGTEVPWADAEGDELWSDRVGSRPVSTTPWTGPTWDDQPWAEPSPGAQRPDLSAFIAPAEVAQAPAEVAEASAEVAEASAEAAEAPAEVEAWEPEPQEPAPQERESQEPEAHELQPHAREPQEPEPQEPESREPEPAEPEAAQAAADRAQPALAQWVRSAWESLGLSEPTTAPTWTPEPDAEPASTAEPDAEPNRVADAADFAEPEPAWSEPESAAEPAWAQPEATVESEPEPAWSEPEATVESEPEPAWSEPEPAAESTAEPEATAESAPEPAWSTPEPVSERFEDQASAPAEPELSEQAEPTEQAFAAFAPQREPEFVPESAGVVAEALPARELEREPEAEPQVSRPYEPFEVIDGGAVAGSIDTPAGDIETSLGAEDDWDGRSERRQPTTAEQVVPWLIGVILLLVGMVILLVALIFTSDNGLLAGFASPSGGPNDSAGAGVGPSPDLADTPRGTASSSTATSKPSTTAPPSPTFGPLDMVYLGRSAALAHIYLLRHDFTAAVAPVVLARDPAQDVEHLSWSADGTHGAAIIAGRLITIEGSKPKRALADGIVASTFAPDGKSIYALRIVIGNGTDRAEVLKITYATGAAAKLTEWTYLRPVLGTESAVKEAQFADEGGPERLYWMSDGTLRIWMLGAPTYRVTPTGRTTKLPAATLPVLWSGEGIKRIQMTESGETTTISLRSADGKELAKTTVKGLISHLRWSPDDSQVVFTLGRSVGGGVQQDLFLWNLSADKPPMQLTNTGAAFGAEWLGTAQAWRP